MAAMSRGPVTKPSSKQRAPKRVKGGTASSRNHTWKGFSQRVAQIKIEPIRRGRSTILDDAELETTFSYFRDAFVEWRELNMAEAFTAFARKVAPLCESLPQVLHHSDRILDLLVEHIAKGDKFGAEPLLSLMAHLAHDLGEKFEKYFEKAVTTVSQLAATHPAVEVIEWSFSCLAWLFKYLSRLLVPDLRPVFDLMSPLLGKRQQKAFVSRFAAESLSFLIRKAGASYHRDRTPLKLIIRHISAQVEELQDSAKDHAFQQGVKFLLADSLKGVQRGFHSSATAIVQELLTETFNDEHVALRAPPLEPVLVGVVTASIHHTDAENFKPLLDVILAHIDSTSSDSRHVGLSSRLLLVACGVRRGDRVGDWKPVLDSLGRLLDSVKESANIDTSDAWDILTAVSVVFQSCALDAAIPHEKLLEGLARGQWEKYFLPFCNLFADLGAERFRSLLLPYFKRFVAQKAHDHGSELCAILPQLYQNGTLSAGVLQPSERWQTLMDQPFLELARSHKGDEELRQITYHCNALLDVIAILGVSDERSQSVWDGLGEAFKRSVRIEVPRPLRTVDIFATGNGFLSLVERTADRSFATDLWTSVCQASAVYGHSLSFWRALLVLVEREKANLLMQGPHMEPLKQALMLCLRSPSHDMRLIAIYILEIIAGKNEELRNLISVAMMVEQTPPGLDNQRSISMRIGQLANLYPALCSDDWIGEAIPTFCFGLLHVRLSSAWDDTCRALKAMCSTKEGEGVVTKIALEWLSEPSSQDDAAHSAAAATPNPAPKQYATEFECTNVMELQELVVSMQASWSDVEGRLATIFEDKHTSIPFSNSMNRTQALRLFDSLPHLAEKRSRLLVPVLLDWALDQRTPEPWDDVVNGESQDLLPHRWNRKDQKAMLSVFSKFTNPKVLYRANEVHEAFLALLSNGDLEIQKAALRALLTWKDPAISPYQEDLLNLLDDARFRDELPVFLSEGKLQDEDLEHVLPIVLRLLYGKVIAGKKGLESKRKSVFVGLKNRFGDEAVRQFLEIALGPLSDVSILQDGILDEALFQRDLMDARKQVGFLNMLEDLLSTFKTTFTPYTVTIVDPVLYCLVKASRDLSTVPPTGEDEPEEGRKLQVSLLKTIRQRALQSLGRLFETCPDFAWQPYTASIVKELVEPRLDQFPIETAQSVSGLLRLFAAWAKSLSTAPFLVEHNSDILIKIVDCLEIPSAKDEVLRFVLDDILRNIISLVAKEPPSVEAKILRNRIQTDIVQPFSTAILNRVGNLLRKSPSKEVLESGVQTIAELAPHVVGSAESRSMIEIATFLLRQPSKRVNPRTKLGLLRILHEFIQRCESEGLNELFDSIYDAICPMFAFFNDRTSRTVLCDIIQDLSDIREELVPVAKLCHNANANAKSRLDEPDFDRRSQAFNEINEGGFRSYSLMQWKPLVYNMLYFIRDNEELSIRVNASLTLRRFIEISESEEFKEFISTAILPGLQNGMREASELVRVEYLAVLEQLVKVHREWAPVSDLYVLISDDDEASFFSNVLHIQGHRRLRALRRLAANASHLRGGNVYHILMPLLEHFVFNKADDEGADNLAGETVKTLSALTESLEWPQFRSLLRRYIGYLTSKEDMQKAIIRLIGGLMDGLSRAGRAKGYITTTQVPPTDDDATEAEVDADAMQIDSPVSTLSKTLPQQEKLTSDLINNFLPGLTEFLHKKDESTVSLRVPVAIAVTKVLLVLPVHETEARLPAVLLDICYILKSRAQESRDMARNTLSDIAVLMGSSYVGFILKALRTALQRGYQLHVFSFTLHHIMVKLSDQLKPGDLDYCLSDIVDVVMDDTFGIAGQEKDAEEYISKMKEVKSSKSFDSMDIIARSTTPAHLVKLVIPIRSLLLEKLNARMVQKIDELLRRIGLGVLQNPTVNSRDILVFCYELIQEVYKASASMDKKTKIDPKTKRFLVNNKGAAKSGARLSTSSYVYKITRFSLDILRTVLRKHDDLQTSQNLAGFLPVIGDAMVQGQEEVQVSAVRLLTTIIKVPMSELDTNCPVYVDEAMRAIKGAPSSNTELAQASLKLVSAMLRERPNVQVKERDIGHLLKRMQPDLDEPDRQGVTFGFLKAVMNRHFDVPEIYESMDKVAEMMITNHTKSARDVARSHYFQFLTSYTQSEKRFKKQMEFLLKNLRYEHVEGRQSVMEALDLIITKALPRFPEKAQYEYYGMMFLPLINTLANDDSSKCRELASLLIKRLFQHASDKRRQSFATDLKSWLEQDDNAGLKRLGIQCWGFYFEAVDIEDGVPKELSYVLDRIDSTIDASLSRRDEDDWELLYYSLILLSKACKLYTEGMFSSNKESLWTAVQASVSYPHAWVKLKSAELMGTYFAHLAVSNKDTSLDALPLKGSGGLQLAEQNMIHLTNAFLKNLVNPEVTEQLCTQSVKNIAFLARCLAVNGAKWQWQKSEDDNETEDVATEGKDVLNGIVTSDDEFSGFSPPPKMAKPKSDDTAPPAAIHRLVARLSGLIRPDKISLNAKTATLSLLETMTAKFPLEPLATSIPHLLTTLNTLVDPATTIPRSFTQATTLNEPTDVYKALIDKAREVMNTLQKRMGTPEYLKVMSDVQKAVRERREERRRKRKVEAVADPERWEKEKRRRHDVKRVKRKERGAEHMGKRRGW
ncbi:U3 snoRNP protein Utp20 [Dothidotthia symphoricarpi CBS 119687]|uniref:U3 snoRNP protein Utp20 n=1 Tax=Dothidotthia symphoricarpi CBS 119687 TaxID=1392245 RepID=A0A6A6ATZ1_9PLEO|nr:U3 snoRNP protein Utp20 [Dothidotthia symphoricarpi CBS 119687]KAF2134425.1 U3 snoRNP protein Utp20 [Dothidotthia symphoricarpi CBS 119687]